MQKQTLPLTHGWQLKERDEQVALTADFYSTRGWHPARVPGTVQQDLLAAGCIPDPFVGMHEQDVQWIGERSWLYRTTFDLAPALLSAPELVLCFEGLDTLATVWLNGTEIVQSCNMFVPRRVAVHALLRPQGNELWLLFSSVLPYGREQEARWGKKTVWSASDPSRVYVRKAQYHYGWDWGPTLLTAGPWRPILLEAYSYRIKDLACHTYVNVALDTATLPIQIEIEGGTLDDDELLVQLTLQSPDGTTLAVVNHTVINAQIEHTFVVDQPQLWWPHGYGAQPLYRLTATLYRGAQRLDERTLRLGLRHLQLVQRELVDDEGTSFFFMVNQVPLFCGGANWIPLDPLLPRVTAEQYRQWIELAVQAHMVMLRVWGGGIYEEDVFYDLCDELGVLVWQDFLFACGIYPGDERFQASVQAEAEAAIRRLRNHTSIVLWCGNNEDYPLAAWLDAYHVELAPEADAEGFPARVIYERLLPDLCQKLDPTRPYWPGSPYGGKDGSSTTVGDQHVWHIWHGTMEQYHDYSTPKARFVSEFGMQAYPTPATIVAFTPTEERFPQSRTLEFHNKAYQGPRRLATYLVENVRIPERLEEYIYATQLVQAEALVAGVAGWRRQWRGPGYEYVSGALVWQLNDCWPSISWAVIDYALRPKPAYYALSRALAPLALGLARQVGGQSALWAVNGTLHPVQAEIVLQRWTMQGEHLEEKRFDLALEVNRAAELGTFAEPGPGTILSARLELDGEVQARTALWPEPFKYQSFPDPQLCITTPDAQTLRLDVQRPAKGVWLSAHDGIVWSDNMLDLFPGDPQTIRAVGLRDPHLVHAQWLH